MKYKPSRDLPEFALQHKTLSPSKLVDIVLMKRNEKRTPESITMWFNRNPDLYEKLSKNIISNLPTEKDEVEKSIFENGAFQELISVKKWIQDLTLRGAKQRKIKSWVRYLKRVCQGNIRKDEYIEDWSLKHPDRLTIQDAKDFIFTVKKHGYPSREWRLALRNFLKSKNIVVKSEDISGELEEDAGKYADIFIPKEKIHEIFEWLKARNYEAYLASKFGYKTASRITATLNAHTSHINHEERTITVFEKSIKGKKKRKVTKLLTEDLYEEMPKQGKLFSISARELNKLLREAYKEIIPELEPRIPMPFHFIARHMFAQHMLRASNWNYGLVASLGGWSMEALRRYYGMPPKEVVKKFGFKTLPKLEV